MGYSEHFSSTKSRSNFEQISNRLRKSRIVDSEVTDFLRERITIEEKYVADLLRLSKKGLSVEKDQLGGINDSWDKILALTSATADSHKAFCVEINDTIDRSNRARIEKELSFPKQKLLEGDIQKINKEYEDELKKLKKQDGEGKGISFFKKLKSRDGSGNSENMANVQKAGEIYVGKLRPLLEKAQLYDESRLIVLFEVLKAFARSELTIHTKMADVASSVAEVLNNFDIAENVETFCRKKGTNTDGGFTGTYDSAESPSSRKDSVVTASTAPTLPPIVDSEGFSLPPISTPKWPPPAGATFDSDDEDSRKEQAQPKFKIEIKDKAVSENPEISMQAMQNVVASMLPLQPKSLGSGAPNQSSAISDPRNNVSIDAVITETINLLLKDGEIEKLMVSGEVSVVLPNSSSVGKCRAVLQGSESIERVVINDQFASQPDFNQQTLIELDLSRISELGGAPAPILKYKLQIDPSDYEQYAPVFFSTLWKPDPTHSSFLLAYQYNEDFKAQAPLQGLSFLLNLQNASNISSVQTIPTGIWNPEKKALLWRVDDIRTDDIASSETHKLLARFETQDDLASAQVAVKFSSPTLCSEVGFDLLDTDGVLLRNIEKTTITGKYGSF